MDSELLELCSGASVISELAADPSIAPRIVCKKLFRRSHIAPLRADENFETEATRSDIETARQCGRWGTTVPSDTFLKIFHEVLHTLRDDPLGGMVSPPLMGSCGVVPLTIVAPLLDICRHMSNCIVRAKKEVFLATNYWMHSEASGLITNALQELSKRAGEKGDRVVVKIMYDRGSPKQLWDNYLIVPEAVYTSGSVKLPAAAEIPSIDLEVMNHHRPLFGTFHSKFMIIDREIALLSSNNIQDNDNLEMMTRLEGPIVDSFYDMCCISWNKEMIPPLPLLTQKQTSPIAPSFAAEDHTNMFDEAGNLKHISRNVLVSCSNNHNQMQSANGCSKDVGQNEFTSGNSLHVDSIQGFHDSRLFVPQRTANDSHYDADLVEEVKRSQSVLLPRDGETCVEPVTRLLNTTKTNTTQGDAPGWEPKDGMQTYVPLPKHDPVPMAMVCRKPWGPPDLSSLHVPQNAAFMGAIRHAQRTVFIQTPNLNAAPLLEEIVAAVKRKVEITIYVCLGYNDAGELLPYQGGHNEAVAHRLYQQLSSENGERDLLRIYNYIAKDQTKPIHNSRKQRSCHIKLLITDGHIGIQGNGNQDTQSWFHSQEINVMLDSAQICASWLETIRRNQNTHLYGAVATHGPEAGCWHDTDGIAKGKAGGKDKDKDKDKDSMSSADSRPNMQPNSRAVDHPENHRACQDQDQNEDQDNDTGNHDENDPATYYGGRQAEGAIGVDAGRFAWARGIIGAVQRVRGAGGF